MDFSVQFGSMEQATAALRAIGEQLLSISETLEQRVLQGVAELEGETRTQFDLAHRNYQQIHLQLQQQVAQSSPTLTNIQDGYLTNETRGAALWT